MPSPAAFNIPAPRIFLNTTLQHSFRIHSIIRPSAVMTYTETELLKVNLLSLANIQ